MSNIVKGLKPVILKHKVIFATASWNYLLLLGLMHSKLSHIDEQIVLARDTVIYVSDVSSHVSKPISNKCLVVYWRIHYLPFYYIQ